MARVWLSMRVPAAEREYVEGDLYEGYLARRGLFGAWQARLWYWRQVVSIRRSTWSADVVRPPSPSRGARMASWTSDLRFAFRGLRRAPLFTALVILTLAIGIGATSAIFSVVYPVVLADPPYPRADRLVMVWERDPNGTRDNLGWLTGEDIRRETSAFASMAMVSYWSPTVQAGEAAQPLAGLRVSHEYFATLGVRPVLGRDFTAEEDHQATRRVVILSHLLWRRLFAADSAVIGRPTLINGVSYLVAGVMPAGFRDMLSPQAEIWAPLGYEPSLPYACRTCHHLRAVARLKDGVTLASARREVDQYLRTLRERYPDQYATEGALLPTLHEDATGEVRGPLLGIFTAVLLLLLLACTNVANLFLGRTGERHTDLAIRMALGAARGRLVRLVALEAVLLSIVGGGLGVLTAWLGTRMLLGVMAVPVMLTGRVEMALPVVSFAVLVTTVSALIGGALPALLALGESALSDIRIGTRAVLGRVRHRLRHGVVVTEVALAVLLLAGAGLQVRSLRQALAVDTGFEPSGLLTMSMSLVGPRYSADGSTRRYYRQLLDEAAAAPGVQAVAVVSQLPLGGNFDASSVHRQDKPAANPEQDPSAQRFAVSPAYLDAMQIRVLRGRSLTPADREGSEPVMLLNRSGATRIFGTDDPIGKRIKIGGMDGPWRTIVGIVDDVRHLSLERAPESQMYLPFDQNPYEEPALSMVVRVSGPQASVARGLTAVARRLDPGVAVASVRGMDDVIRQVVAPRRLAMSLVGGFAIIAAVLALGGLYGVMTASVGERVREMGLRAALGATPGALVSLVIRHGLGLVVTGTAIGLSLFVAARGVVIRFVFGVSPGDPATLAGVAVLLGIAAMLACLLPAVRAARVEPLVALRE